MSELNRDVSELNRPPSELIRDVSELLFVGWNSITSPSSSFKRHLTIEDFALAARIRYPFVSMVNDNNNKPQHQVKFSLISIGLVRVANRTLQSKDVEWKCNNPIGEICSFSAYFSFKLMLLFKLKLILAIWQSIDKLYSTARTSSNWPAAWK